MDGPRDVWVAAIRTYPKVSTIELISPPKQSLTGDEKQSWLYIVDCDSGGKLPVIEHFRS